MARAAANVQVGIMLRGEDRASAALNKTARSTDKLSRSMKKGQTRAQGFGTALKSAASGDLRGAVSGLKGAIGGGGVGLVGAIGGATVATAALAAGAAFAAVKFTQWSIEIERTRASMDHAFGSDGLEKAIALSNKIGGVSAIAVGKLAAAIKLTGVNARFSVEQLQELTARATSAGKTGDEAIMSLAKALQTGTTRSLKLVGTFINSGRVLDEYARSVGKTTTQLKQHEIQQAIAVALVDDLNRKMGTSSEIFARQDDALKDLDNAWLQLKATISALASEDMVEIVEGTLEIIHWLEKWAEVAAEVGKLLAGLFVIIYRTGSRAIDALSLLLEGRFVDSIKAAGDALLQMLPITFIAQQVDAINDAMDRSYKRAERLRRLVAQTGIGTDPARLKLKYRSRAAAAAARRADPDYMGDPGRGKSLALTLKRKKLPRRKGQPAAAKAAAAAAAAAKAESDAIQRTQALQLRTQAILAEGDAAAMARVQLKQIEFQKTIDIETAKMQFANNDIARANAVAAIEANAAAQRAAIHRQTMADKKAEMMAGVGVAMATASAAVDGIGQVMQAEKQMAGVKAILALAEGAFAVAKLGPAGIPQLVQGIFAAAQFALAAGSGGATSPPLSGSAAGASMGGGGSFGAEAGGGSATTVYNFYGTFLGGTPQQLGKAINSAQGSMAGTGL